MKRTSIALFTASFAFFLLSLANLSPGPTAAPEPKVVEVTGTVDVGNLPAQQEVVGTVDVGNLPAQQEVFGMVEVSNFPIPIQISFKGVTATGFQGNAGIGTFNAACNTDYPGTRMCTTKEYIETIGAPAVESEAWIRPILFSLSYQDFVFDFTGYLGRVDSLTCGAWTSISPRGMTVGINGRIDTATCDSTKAVACCGY